MEIIIDSMGPLVISVVLLLINHMVNVTDTFRDILKHYFLQTHAIKFAKRMM